MKRIVLFLIASLALTASQAQTEKVVYSFSGGLLGAANFSKFNVTDDQATYETKTGWSAGGWLNFRVGRGFSIEPQITYTSQRYLTNDPATLLLNDGSIKSVSIPLALKFHLAKVFAITAGPQLDIITSIDDNDNLRSKNDFNKTNFSLFGGVELFPAGRVSLFGRYVHGLSDMDNRIGHSPDMEYKNRNIQVGLKLRLFGKKVAAEPAYQATSTPAPLDSDGDGIIDELDKCPNQPGFSKYNGCPVPDSDGDGINDEQDKCPNQAGIAKYEGCPIPDTDGDGINDEEDKCPNQAGTAKYEGCPIPDKDGDGINDEEDRCPDIAGVSSNNGCPEVPANVTKSLQVASSNIGFGTGTKNTTLTVKSTAQLDKVVTIMNENPGLNIRVEGHTDNAGDDEANMTLSQDRANAVKDYLVSKGISESRITAEGLGETMPIADNSTAAGRAKNRRIEIKMAY